MMWMLIPKGSYTVIAEVGNEARGEDVVNELVNKDHSRLPVRDWLRIRLCYPPQS